MEHKIIISAELSELNTLRREIEKILYFIDILELNRIILAIDEIISNIIEHGYHQNQKQNITIILRYYESEEKLVIEIIDQAVLFNPLHIQRPDFQDHVKQGKSRGLGLFLVKSIMDEWKYEPISERGNRNILIKYISKQ